MPFYLLSDQRLPPSYRGESRWLLKQRNVSIEEKSRLVAMFNRA